MTTKLIDGFAEWTGSEDCLSLKYWYVQDKTLKFFKALCPHGQPTLRWDETVPSQHILNAIDWLETEAIPSAKKVAVDLNTEVYRYNPEYRGYLSGYPVASVDKWTNDLNELSALALSNISFLALIEQEFSMPRFLQETSQAQKIKQLAFDFIQSSEVQTYLKQKAEDMASFWAKKLGSLGQCGDATVNALHAIVRRRKGAVAEQDRLKFKEALINHCLRSFNNGIVPFYDTDYKVKGLLYDVLEENNLIHLASHFPWKTWKNFDFSDAPSIKAYHKQKKGVI